MQGRARHLTYVPLVAIALTMGLPGCSAMLEEDAPDAEMAGFCVDAGDIRVDDDQCGDYNAEGIANNPGYSYVWIPMNSNYAIPPTGSFAWQYFGKDKAVRKVTSGKPIARGLPKTGGSLNIIQRGGFGIKGGTTAGTGAKAGSAGS